MHDALTRLQFSATRNPQTGVIDHANLFLLVDRSGTSPTASRWIRATRVAPRGPARPPPRTHAADQHPDVDCECCRHDGTAPVAPGSRRPRLRPRRPLLAAGDGLLTRLDALLERACRAN